MSKTSKTKRVTVPHSEKEEATAVASKDSLVARIGVLAEKVTLLESRSFAANKKFDLIAEAFTWGGAQLKSVWGLSAVGDVFTAIADRLNK